MKKIIALILSLMMLLPAAGLCDSQVLDFGDFTLTVTDTDAIETAAEKVAGSPLFVFYPNYDENATFFNNMNAVWDPTDTTGMVALLTEADLNDIVTQAAAGMTAEGMTATNETLLSYQIDAENGVFSMVYCVDVDYSALGLDLQVTLFMSQTYISLGSAGTYVFTITTASMDELVELVEPCLNAVSFK